MDKSLARLLELAIAIQQIPAPTFEEGQRAGFVRSRFSEQRLTDVTTDSTGNVYARLGATGRARSGTSRPLIVSAHLDTVFSSSVDLRMERDPQHIQAPGIGDNSLGVAGLFGLVWALQESGTALPGELWLVANACEEGLGDLRGMRAVVDRFGLGQTGTAKKTSPLAYVVIEGMSLGQVYHRALGVRRYRIRVRTAGGHSWNDYGQPSAVHELTSLSTRLTALEVPRSPRTSLNIGVISGGSSVNTIAAEAMLELDLRSESAATLDTLASQVEGLVRSMEKTGVTVQSELIGCRPAGGIPAEHPLVQLAQDCLRSVGIEPRLNIGSTDANLPLSHGFPAVTIGLTTGGRAHTVHEFINLEPLQKGMEQLVRLVSRAWE